VTTEVIPGAGPGQPHSEAALALKGISKTFGSTRVLRDVDLFLEPGARLGLLGENGSGKSTLVKILAGYHAPDPGGTLWVGGRELPLPVSATSAREHGMAFVFQDLGLARKLTVVENLLISSRNNPGTHGLGHLNARSERASAGRTFASYGLHLNPSAVVDTLPPVDQAMLAIVRAAEELRRFRERSGSAKAVMLLDEPTVFLPQTELAFLYDLIRNVSSDGVSVLLISHNLEAVREVCTDVLILRNGAVAGRSSMASVSDAELVTMITGRSQQGGKQAEPPAPRRRARTSGTASATEPKVTVTGAHGTRVIDVSFTIGEGEIVGVTGLLGSGIEELPYLLFGPKRASAGTIRVGSRELALDKLTPVTAVGGGIALVPADRRRDGGIGRVSAQENLLITTITRYWQGFQLSSGRMRARAADRCEAFGVLPRKPDALFETFSGGNQQKVILAKWLEHGPQLLVLHEPTQGVDVGARAEIYRLLERAAEDGLAVLWVTADAAELAEVSDRVLVLTDGRITAELTSPGLTKSDISSAVFDRPAAAPAHSSKG
jgi:ribose transport system ATP-binding protein